MPDETKVSANGEAVRRAADALNSAIQEAWYAGLEIRITVEHVTKMDRTDERPIIVARVSRPV